MLVEIMSHPAFDPLYKEWIKAKNPAILEAIKALSPIAPEKAPQKAIVAPKKDVVEVKQKRKYTKRAKVDEKPVGPKEETYSDWFRREYAANKGKPAFTLYVPINWDPGVLRDWVGQLGGPHNVEILPPGGREVKYDLESRSRVKPEGDCWVVNFTLGGK